MSETQRQFAICSIQKQAREKVIRQIDMDSWKHSWHLPKSEGGWTDWNNLETLTKCRDVLYDQITEAKRVLKVADECLHVVVNAMIDMEKQIKEENSDAVET